MATSAGLLMALTLTAPCLVASDGDRPPATPSETLREVYESGQRFQDFLQEADRRKALWDENYGTGTVNEEDVERARAIGGRWHVLAIAVDGCSDSVNTIPFVALLTEAVDGLDMRIVDSNVGRVLMEARPTPDGRAATPTLILLNENYEEVGCWIERPSPLQEWALAEGSDLNRRDFMRQKMSWYRDDGGATTVTEIVDVLEAASRGTRICGS